MTARDPRLRAAWAESLTFALSMCHPDEAAPICAAYLEDHTGPGPTGDFLGYLRHDAQFWADTAPPHELAAYTLAGLHVLPGASITTNTVKRALWALWQRLPPSARLAFLKRTGNEHPRELPEALLAEAEIRPGRRRYP